MKQNTSPQTSYNKNRKKQEKEKIRKKEKKEIEKNQKYINFLKISENRK